MSLASLSVKRPAFITCVVLATLAMGYMALKNLGVDLFPNVTFPVVMVTTPYPGAGPEEIETQVSKVLEDEISSLAGVNSMRSVNKEGFGTVIVEFSLETDVKYAEQQIRDRVSAAKAKLPSEVKEPMIRRLDPGDQPVLILNLQANLPEAKLFEFTNEVIRPQLEQVNQVGLVEVMGGRKREIRVELDRGKLAEMEVPASLVASRISTSGQNIPVGKVAEGKQETLFRTLGQFRSLEHISSTVVNFVGNDVPVTVGQLGEVVDSLQDEKSQAFVNGEKSIFLMIYRQSGANSIAVGDGVKKKIASINKALVGESGAPELRIVRDRTKFIRANIVDVQETILIGILLTILTVFCFLGSVRSTVITGLALPNSLLGAFVLMYFFGFTVNVMTLLALSLAVGLLIDDAIVVRENIFRHRELGKNAVQAAIIGTKEVTLAVVATSLTVIAVFGPIAFLNGIVGQFFKEFGLTICFTMLISLFDALTIAPMLSAYYAGSTNEVKSTNAVGRSLNRFLAYFGRFQKWCEDYYARTLEKTMRRPLVVLASAVGIFLLSIAASVWVPKTFLPPQDTGEFQVSLDMPPGTNIKTMSETARQVDQTIRANREVAKSVLTIGNRDGEPNVADIYVELVPRGSRAMNTSVFKDLLRDQLKPFSGANPMVKDMDDVAGGFRTFNVSFIGTDLGQLQTYGKKIFERVKHHPSLKDVDISTREGKPEFQIVVDDEKARRLGVSSSIVGHELRTQIEGSVPAVYREAGREYDIRVRLRDDQRNLKEAFYSTFVPNINHSMVRLQDVASPVSTLGVSSIERQDRGRYVQISADIAASGPGMGGIIGDLKNWFANDPELKLPDGVHYKFVGQSENFEQLASSIMLAVTLAVIFIYFVLASLYESFVTPFTIMLVLPLAACGAFFALFLTGTSLNLFSMIGCVMLLGIATKNSILIVDRINQNLDKGMDRMGAILEAGRTRLRPILMTSYALIAGMLPVAIGLNEASKQRNSMGIAIIGGLITSTFLTLIVIPAAFIYVDRFRVKCRDLARRWAGTEDDLGEWDDSQPATAIPGLPAARVAPEYDELARARAPGDPVEPPAVPGVGRGSDSAKTGGVEVSGSDLRA